MPWFMTMRSSIMFVRRTLRFAPQEDNVLRGR
jgi:hypothetical protein